MAFDEEYHLGLIKLYAGHPSPFWDGQPAGANSFGSVATDPSYFYHWVMSFPYRFATFFTDSATVQIIALRLLNIVLFIAAIPIWRRVMQKMGVTTPLVHAILALFVLIPIVPLLAGQINYDNLLFLLIAATCLLTFDIISRPTKNKTFPLAKLCWLAVLCLLAALTKYAFLPIFVVIVLAIGWRLRATYHSWSACYRACLRAIISSFMKSRYAFVGSLVVVLVCCLLFIQRDIGNVVRYHTPAPSCDAVLSVEECSEYGPWIRDYDLARNKQKTNYSPLAFSFDWVRGMWHRSIFTLAGPTVDYQTRGPLTAPAYTTIALGLLALIAVLWRGVRVFRNGNSALKVMTILSLVYVLALWLDGYEAYVRTGQAVAINGRYLLLVLLPIGAFLALCISDLLGKRPALKTLIISAALLGMLWGGGVLTFIIRSNDTWYWPNQTIIAVNRTVREWLIPITPGSDRPTQFLP